jgi:hypothetical protein
VLKLFSGEAHPQTRKNKHKHNEQDIATMQGDEAPRDLYLVCTITRIGGMSVGNLPRHDMGKESVSGSSLGSSSGGGSGVGSDSKGKKIPRNDLRRPVGCGVFSLKEVLSNPDASADEDHTMLIYKCVFLDFFLFFF